MSRFRLAVLGFVVSLSALVAGTVAPVDAAPTYPAQPELPGGWADIEATRSGDGYWVLAANGSVQGFGAAPDLGGTGQLKPGEKAVTLSGNSIGNAYWVFTSTGRVIPHGIAINLGDASQLPLVGPIVDSVGTPSGIGYYLVASDGGVFNYGDAAFFGSMGGKPLNAPIVALAPTATGRGYWLVASDGGVFAFGDATFRGSMGGKPLNAPINGIVRYGNGYLLVAADGGVFVFSDLPFTGSLGGQQLTSAIVAATPKATGGYWLLARSGDVYRFGAADNFGSPVALSPACANSAYGLGTEESGVGKPLLRIDLTTGQTTRVGYLPLTPGPEYFTLAVTQSCNEAVVGLSSPYTSMILKYRISNDTLGLMAVVPGNVASLTADGNFVLSGTQTAPMLRRLDDGSALPLDPALLETLPRLVDPTARLAVIYAADGGLELRDLDTGALVYRFPAGEAAYDWSPRHDVILTGRGILDLATGSYASLTQPPQPVGSYRGIFARGDDGFVGIDFGAGVGGNPRRIDVWDRTGAFVRAVIADVAIENFVGPR